MKTSKKQQKIWLDEIKSCLKRYYRISWCKRNQYRFDYAFEIAKKQIEKGEEYVQKGAQWGGKWGNYYRLIALNSKGHYEYVEGFNPYKLLS